jgi:hypothetical protein
MKLENPVILIGGAPPVSEPDYVRRKPHYRRIDSWGRVSHQRLCLERETEQPSVPANPKRCFGRFFVCVLYPDIPRRLPKDCVRETGVIDIRSFLGLWTGDAVDPTVIVAKLGQAC